MKVIFVGMHNKKDKVPLCSSTKSGKLVDRIIGELQRVECLKTNLYNIDYYPSQGEKFDLAVDWSNRVKPKENDVIVLLGAEVHNNYISNLSDKIIKIAHPSSKRSHESMDEYVNNAAEEIKKQGISLI